MTDVWFYHLERQTLEHVLPKLLERALDRKWRVTVQATTPERVAALDALLWTYDEGSFLPHGSARDGDEGEQPVWLTAGDDNPNRADMRVFVDGAAPEPILADPGAAPSSRAIIVFDGRDADALARARAQFRTLKGAGHALSYWRQAETGRWEQQA